MEATLEPLLTVKEVAEYLRTSEKTVRAEIARNRIGIVRVGPKGGKTLIRETEVERYVAERIPSIEESGKIRQER